MRKSLSYWWTFNFFSVFKHDISIHVQKTPENLGHRRTLQSWVPSHVFSIKRPLWTVHRAHSSGRTAWQIGHFDISVHTTEEDRWWLWRIVERDDFFNFSTRFVVNRFSEIQTRRSIRSHAATRTCAHKDDDDDGGQVQQQRNGRRRSTRRREDR